MVIYRVELDPSRPLRYRHGDDTRAIVPSRYPIAVRGDDGTVATRSYTRYRSAVGPMIATAAAPWGGPGGHAFTVHDVTGGALALDAYLAMARARDQAGFEAALALHATPFVNTVYVDGTGTALYVDGSRVPDLAPEALATWQLLRKVAPPIEAAWRQRLVILDGSEPANDLLTDEPRAPGAIPIARAPRVERRDFVMNANDSFRFTNLAAPETLAPASPLWGDDAERPSVRTLANLAALAPGAGPAGPDDRFTLDEAIAAMLGNASWTAARLRDDVAAACPRRATGDLARACAVLAAWDGEFDVTSRGALVWREVLAGLEVDGALPWARRFDRQAPAPDPPTACPCRRRRSPVPWSVRSRACGPGGWRPTRLSVKASAPTPPVAPRRCRAVAIATASPTSRSPGASTPPPSTTRPPGRRIRSSSAPASSWPPSTPRPGAPSARS
jgi:acyl-homoserine-lactone acylase